MLSLKSCGVVQLLSVILEFHELCSHNYGLQQLHLFNFRRCHRRSKLAPRAQQTPTQEANHEPPHLHTFLGGQPYSSKDCLGQLIQHALLLNVTSVRALHVVGPPKKGINQPSQAFKSSRRRASPQSKTVPSAPFFASPLVASLGTVLVLLRSR